MPVKPSPKGPFIRGVNSATDAYTQPRGSVPRASNLIMTDRGALTDCDGSSIVNWFGGAVQNNRGRFLADTLYSPTGVNPYYMALAQALDQQLGAPHAVSATPSAGGTLSSGTTYFYVITALDGVGGETIASNEISGTPSGGNLSNTLVWNVVPNAFGYNVYRSTTTGLEKILTGGGLPKLQPAITGTVTYIDTGAAVSFSQTATRCFGVTSGGVAYIQFGVAQWTALSSLPQVGQQITATGFTPGTFNGTFTVTQIGQNPLTGATNIIVKGGPGTGSASVLGTVATSNIVPPLSDTTQQTVLFQMPTGVIPVSYSNANIAAFFPASLSMLGQTPTGGTGGGGTTGPGVIGSGSATPSGGVAGLVGPLPQMQQFTNRLCIALGNGFSPQLFWDSTGSVVNPAPTGAIASVSVTGDQVTVTVPIGVTISKTDPTKNGFMPVDTNVVLSNMSDSTYNGVFPVIAATAGAGGTFVIRNPNASGGASTGTFTVSTTPFINTFLPAYPLWAASSSYAIGSIIQPTAAPGYYFKAVQGGTSGGSEPTWSNAATLGQEISDGQIIWQNQGSVQASAPAPPGAGHIYVYSGELWVLNTSR
jgi:hypothetical protein